MTKIHPSPIIVVSATTVIRRRGDLKVSRLGHTYSYERPSEATCKCDTAWTFVEGNSALIHYLRSGQQP